MARARADVVDAELRFWAADYEASLAAAERAQALLDPWSGAEVRASRARALLISGMALGALGDDDAARDRFGEALAEDPSIELPDPPPPKLARLFEDARAARDTGPAATASP
jgi:hypothetical protein